MHSSRQDRLNSIEHLVGNQRIEVSPLSDDAIAGRLHDAHVQLVLQHRAERLGADRQALSSLQPSTGHFVQQFLFCKTSAGEVSKNLLDNRSSLGVGDEALPVRPWNVDVADRGEERPSSHFQGGLHPGTGAIRPHVIVELREGREDALHQLASGRVVDRFGRRP